MRIPQGAARWRQYAAPRRVNLLIAGGLLIWGLPDVPWWWEHPGHRDTIPAILAALALTLVMSVPFCWRRRFPFLVLAAAASVLVVRDLLHHDPVSAFAAVLVAAYGAGSYGGTSRRYARGLGCAALVGAVVVVLTSHGARLAGGAARAAGRRVRTRRRGQRPAGRVRGRRRGGPPGGAHPDRPGAARRGRASAVRHRGAGRGGPDGRGRRPDPGPVAGPGTGTVAGTATGTMAGAAMGTVEQLAREALAELNHLLGALRREPDASAAHPPAPTLAELDGLVAASRAAGTVVDLKVEGRARPLPAGVELSVYRIVQEALANVARHAPRSAAQVTLRYCPGELRVDVVNAAPAGGHRVAGGPRALPGGRGIRGMRERAELYGGQLHAGARPGGGFAVTATIPCDSPAAPVPG